MKVLKFNAIWCSACLVMKKIFKHVENMHPELEFINYDYDMDEDLVEKYNMNFEFQTFDEYLGFPGPINTYSFYNKI